MPVHITVGLLITVLIYAWLYLPTGSGWICVAR